DLRIGNPMPGNPHELIEARSDLRIRFEVPPERPAEDLMIGRLARPHGGEQRCPRICHASAEGVEMEAAPQRLLQQLPRYIVQSEAARRRLLKHAFRDEMTNNSLQRLAISPRRASQLTDLLLPGEDVVSNSQSRSNMHAP